ncbi:MAG: choice-of-anchor L domain-containing protein [Lewinellaceae bacterium]|nr:choice-of-anchor L domain-containing protein [Lewinellaceae bacterium]
MPANCTNAILGWLVLLGAMLSTNPPSLAEPGPRPLQGIVTDGNYSVETLVQDIFVKGACKNIFNIKARGNKAGIGYFENGQETIGINRGIILATGSINSAKGPNNVGDASGDFKDTAGDPDLRQMTSAPVVDAVGIEFDFIPLDSLVTFRYVFASEEYCEFVGSKFNDVFGFFVSGPGISGPFSNGSENVALLPGTRDYVSINTINHRENANFFISNYRSDDASRCGLPWQQSPYQPLIQYDGFTKVLTATLRLIPCETYRLRLVIADVSDGSYDSAVFLEAESFNIGGVVNLIAGSQEGRDTVLEGCSGGFFRVKRFNPNVVDQPITIGVRVSSESSAQQGLDFAAIPRQVTIPSGEIYTDLPITLLVDEEQEPPETIILQLDFPCACIADTARLTIVDPPPLRTGLLDQTICIGDSVLLRAAASGGVPVYHYAWSTGDTTAIIGVRPERDTAFTLQLKDACGRVLLDTVSLRRRTPPRATISGIQEVCIGQPASLAVYFTGQGPHRLTWSIGDSLVESRQNITDNPFIITSRMAGKVRLLQYNDAICEGEVFGQGEIRNFYLQTLVRTQPVSCYGGSDGRINVDVVGGTKPYQFSWNGAEPGPASPSGLTAGEYSLVITDARQCQTSVMTTVRQPPPLEPVVFDCRQFTSPLLSFSATGGTPPYSYGVDGGPFTDETIFRGLTPGNQYLLTIQDALGCTLEQTFIMPALYRKMVELPAVQTLNFGETYTLEPQLNIPLSLVEEIAWDPPEWLSCSDCLNPKLIALDAGTLRIKVTDVFGCTGGAVMLIKLDKQLDLFVPTAFSPNGDGINDRLVVYANTRQIRRIVGFRIFNRWGTQVYALQDFLPNDELIGWDGIFQNNRLRPDVFAYWIEVELTDGTTLVRRGQVNLIR